MYLLCKKKRTIKKRKCPIYKQFRFCMQLQNKVNTIFCPRSMQYKSIKRKEILFTDITGGIINLWSYKIHLYRKEETLIVKENEDELVHHR